MPTQKSSLIELRFPVGGLNRQAGFDAQPPYSTPYCVNVRPFDIVNLSSVSVHGYRQRGGARPGLAKHDANQVGSGPIQLLAQAAVLSTAGNTSNILLAVSGGNLYQNNGGSLTVVGSGPHFNTTARQLQATQIGSKVFVADVRSVNLAGTGGTIASTNRLSDSAVVPDWTALSPAIDTSRDFVFISGTNPLEANVFPITSISAGYIVFTGTMTDQSGGVTWQVGRPPKVYDTAAPTTAPTKLMVSYPIPITAYKTGTVTSVSGAVQVTTGSWANTNIPAAVLAAPGDYEVRLTIPNSNGIGTQYYAVASFDSDTTLTLIDQTNDADCSGVTYTLTWDSDYYGLPPLNCPLCCTYRGRLVLAGGYVWYMSRVFDANDWDYGYDPGDPSRAVAGTSTATGGVPYPIVALIPHSDNYLIFACESSLWLLNADPAYGGQIQAISREVGVLGPNAWCHLPDGSVVFLSRDGLYQIAPGAAAPPTPVSRTKLPYELLNVDWSAKYVSMAYDVEARGLHLYVTPNAGTAGIHYFVDWVAGGFWLVSMPNSQQPTAVLKYAATASAAERVLLAGYGGYVRYYSTAATSDDGTAIVSAVVYGPFRVAGPGFVGSILQLAADLDANGRGVAWGVFAGSTAQDAVAAAVAAGVASGAPWHGTWAAGGNHRDYPRAIGAAMCIMVSGDYGWAIEGLRIETRRGGPIR